MSIPHEEIDSVLDHILPHIQRHNKTQDPKGPFVLGLTGLQGSGKSTWTDALVKALSEQHHYNAINISLDDLYLDHDDLLQLRLSNPSNKLLQTRGQPGTHDIALAVDFFESLKHQSGDIRIPSFEKSKFNGEGGRAPQESWRHLPAGTRVDVVIFEGWCVGFQPLGDNMVRQRWDESSLKQPATEFPTETLREHAVEHLWGVNANLRRYCELFMGPRHFDYLVHLDTDELGNVYQWRIQQEHALRARRNDGMTDEEIVRFVKGYMPAYELYLDQMRQGFFHDAVGANGKGQLRVILNRERKIVNTVVYR
ncbi:hypothetical protein NUU61_001015 [Penicillium alfredii]|uniref:Phosphoribulokinase/uridine kinase domain-containing protein n=1 Tax=Penicillium alfredii TaxID=1506179 RepID=A0A9W9GAP2_9EURO|nr:uncharacterized protein NUU61_001015 [Penicillium alfredii]KAJ5115256.1 hypothetical protein NUU61_001015 [Penicillium alfredii]